MLRGEYREAWAVTEPGAGSDVSAIAATAERDEDEWILNGEKWFVTSEGDPGFYLVLAVAEGEQALFIVEPDAGLELTNTPGFLHDPYLDHHPESSSPTAGYRRRTASPRAEARARGVVPRGAPLHRGALLRRRPALARAGPRVRARA